MGRSLSGSLHGKCRPGVQRRNEVCVVIKLAGKAGLPRLGPFSLSSQKSDNTAARHSFFARAAHRPPPAGVFFPDKNALDSSIHGRAIRLII
jgi:hypothetical protein